uniref:G patch domain-containing protein 11 n=1 Tax=Rhipicephalus appendiculatus TaxID=34631 RepID=A0A131Z4W1_RHIAP
MSGDADEDDYMSMNFLAGSEDLRPGLVHSRATKRRFEAEKKHKESNKMSRTKSTKQLMEDTRTEALSKPLGEENKGFNLLKMMGFKPGMGLGKAATAGSSLKEPIPIVVRANRGGLGQESEARERIEARLKTTSEAECNRMAEEFRNAKRSKVLLQQIEGDLRKSQRACYNLDSTQDITEPEEPWFWPRNTHPTSTDSDVRNVVSLDEDVADGGIVSSDDALVPQKRSWDESDDEEEEEEEEEDADPSERLRVLTDYLRQRHHYCIWCVIRYEDEEDMASCPGPTRADHDDD